MCRYTAGSADTAPNWHFPGFQVSFSSTGPVQINYLTNAARIIMAITYKQIYIYLWELWGMRLSWEFFQYWGYTGPMLVFLSGYKIFDDMPESHFSGWIWVVLTLVSSLEWKLIRQKPSSWLSTGHAVMILVSYLSGAFPMYYVTFCNTARREKSSFETTKGHRSSKRRLHRRLRRRISSLNPTDRSVLRRYDHRRLRLRYSCILELGHASTHARMPIVCRSWTAVWASTQRWSMSLDILDWPKHRRGHGTEQGQSLSWDSMLNYCQILIKQLSKTDSDNDWH